MIFVSGLGAPETPRLFPADRSWLCVEMAPDRGGVTSISRDGSSIRLVARTGTPNGLAVDQHGTIWVAETHPHPSLVRVTIEGTTEIFLDQIDGKAMLLPNDLCFGPDGLLYMTDSGMLMSEWVQGGQLRPDWATADFDGRVYQIDLANRSGRILDEGIRFANGIAFGPDDRLYVNEMITGDVFRYRLTHGHPAGDREHFANVLAPRWPGGFRGPDGMGFDALGRLHCTVYGQQEVVIIDPDGTVCGRIHTQGRNPTNVAWGPEGELRLYVSEHELGQIEVFAADAEGLPLYYGADRRVRV